MPEEPTPDRTRSPEPVDSAGHDRPLCTETSSAADASVPNGPGETPGGASHDVSTAGGSAPAGHDEAPVWSRNAGTATA
ncbi:hypothetical protein, partial [Nocardia nova]